MSRPINNDKIEKIEYVSIYSKRTLRYSQKLPFSNSISECVEIALEERYNARIKEKSVYVAANVLETLFDQFDESFRRLCVVLDRLEGRTNRLVENNLFCFFRNSDFSLTIRSD